MFFPFSDKHKLFAILTFGWFLVTFFSAVLISRFDLAGQISTSFHPRWAIITLGPLFLLQLSWVRSFEVTGAKAQNASARRYLVIFMLVAGLLTGLATQMGFLPFFYHQLAVWPLSIYMVVDFIKNLKMTNPSDKAGFIGCASAEKNLSRDYKKILTSEWNKKHGDR